MTTSRNYFIVLIEKETVLSHKEEAMEKIHLVLPEKNGTISPRLYGAFIEHLGSVVYDGIYCGEDSPAENSKGFRKIIIDALKKAGVSVLRWPGGCFAESYDWKDGIGPKEERPVRVNWWTKFDGRYEPNTVGTDEFLAFTELCCAEPYIAANITSTTPLNIRDWVDYCNSPAGTTTMARLREANGRKEPYNVKLWGVGNENFGGGGNMTPQYYAWEFRRFSELICNVTPDAEMIACGCGAKRDDYPWHREVLDNFATTRSPRKTVAAMALHYYTNDPVTCPDPEKFQEKEWNHLIGIAAGIEEAIVRLWGMALGNKQEHIGKLAIDEWGTWYNPGNMEKEHLWRQQSYQLDAAVAGLTLNTFNNHCDKIFLATIAQLCNCDQALFLAEGEHCILTPTYYVFEMYKDHQNGESIRSLFDKEKVSVSASVKDGILTATIVNLSPVESVEVSLEPLGGSFAGAAQVRLLGDGDLKARNTFEDPYRLTPINSTIESFTGKLTLPRGAVAAVTVCVVRGKELPGK